MSPSPVRHAPGAQASLAQTVATLFWWSCWAWFGGVALVADVYWEDLLLLVSIATTGLILIRIWNTRAARVAILSELDGALTTVEREQYEALKHLNNLRCNARIQLGVTASLILLSVAARQPDPIMPRAYLPGLLVLSCFLGGLEYRSSSIAGSLGVAWGTLTLRRFSKFVPKGLGSVAATIVFVLCLFFFIGVGVRTGAPAWGLPTAGDIRDAITGSGDGEKENDSDGNADGGERGSPPSVLPTAITPVPSPTSSVAHEPPAADAPELVQCERSPRDVISTASDAYVRRQLWKAYSEMGRVEIGCPLRKKVREVNGLFILALEGGESDPTLLISDALGRAEVVFDYLVPRARHLVRKDVLAYVTPRTSYGFGDYQIFVMVDGTCSLSGRDDFSGGYIDLPRSASGLAISVGGDWEAFPALVEAEEANAGARYSVEFRGEAPADDELDVIVVDRDGDASLESGVGERWSRDAPCGDILALEELAERVKLRWKRTYAQ